MSPSTDVLRLTFRENYTTVVRPEDLAEAEEVFVDAARQSIRSDAGPGWTGYHIRRAMEPYARHIEPAPLGQPLDPTRFPLGQLRGEFYDRGRQVVVLRAFAYVDRDGTTLLVPPGTTSDFNSTPRLVWSLFPPGHYPEAGIVHDYLYRNGGTWPRLGDPREHPPWTREQSDQVHRDILELTGASRFLRWAAHRALRLFGRGAWQGQ